MKHLVILSLGFMLASSLSAQDFTEKLKRMENGKGKVVIYQDQAIERLVNGAASKSEMSSEQILKKAEAGNAVSSEQPKEEGNAPKVYRSRYTTVGYRIQVYSGGNSRAAREQAIKKGSMVKKYVGDIPVYTHFHSPRWTCRIGDFRSYAEAGEVLRALKAIGAFGEAVIVKCKIQVAY